MIPKAFITEWRQFAPWVSDAWVEQDLVISRALVELFSDPFLKENLAFRGGTALYKLHFLPSARYSEDIDLVQIRSEPIGPILDCIRTVLDPWLGVPKRKFKGGCVSLRYSFLSEDVEPFPLKLKVEVNTREHFAELGWKTETFSLTNRWFTGQTDITSFYLSELLATKLRALYQRKKGRDLFDLYFALKNGFTDIDGLLSCFNRYLDAEDNTITRAMFEKNLAEKSTMKDFREDILPLLRPDLKWNYQEALALVQSNIIQYLPGEPWKGTE